MEALLALVGPLTQAGLQVAKMIADSKAINETTDPAVLAQALKDITESNNALFAAVMEKLTVAAGQS